MNISSGIVTWKAPSNIAFIKYWGKKECQLPRNPSISMGLNNCCSTTRVDWSLELKEFVNAEKNYKAQEVDFLFDGKREASFNAKIDQFLIRGRREFSFLNNLALKIDSSNSFPHSVGIASSASSFAALALCLIEIDYILLNKEDQIGDDDFFNRASSLARLGSGSAARSMYSFCIWGKYKQKSKDQYATSLSVDSSFFNLCDMVIIVDTNKKNCSSSLGHQLMDSHDFLNSRLDQVNVRLELMLSAISNGDFEKFGKIIEAEAFSLHALMMTSETPYMLMKPNTLFVLQKLFEFRERYNVQLFFTLDAGPNIHLIYKQEIHPFALKFFDLIKREIDVYNICDSVGQGPTRVML